MMTDDDKALAGKIGLGLSIFLWTVCSWRLSFHSWDSFRGRWGWQRREPHGQINPAATTNFGWNQQIRSRHQHDQRVCCTKWITRRRTFHGLLWLATLCELVAYADLSGILQFSSDRPRAINLGYILLNVAGRSILESLAFYTVTAIWLRTAIQASSMDSRRRGFLLCTLPPAFLVLTMMLILASVSLSVVVFTEYPDASHEWVLNMRLSLLQTLLEASCWGSHALVVLLCIRMTSTCIFALVPSEHWQQRLYLLGKAVLPMLVSLLAYTVRCVWLVLAYRQPNRRETWAWLVTFVWTPTVAVSVVLLYSARKRDSLEAPSTLDYFRSSDGNDGNNNLQQPLMLRPQPPEEAFRAFSMVRRGDEMDDSFFWSPIPQSVPRVVMPSSDGNDRQADAADMCDDASTLSRDSLPFEDIEGHTQNLDMPICPEPANN